MAVRKVPLTRRLIALLLVLTLAWAGAATQGDVFATAAPDAAATQPAAPGDGSVEDHHLDDAPTQSAWGGDLPLADVLIAALPLVVPPAAHGRRLAPPPDPARPDAPQDGRFKPPRG